MTQLGPRDLASPMYVYDLYHLPHLELLLYDRLRDALQDVEHGLPTGRASLGLREAFIQAAVECALAAELVRDVGEGVHELQLCDAVGLLRVHVVEQLFQVFDGDVGLQALCADQEVLLAQPARALAVEQVEELLPVESEDVLRPCEVLAALSDQWVHEALVDEGDVDPSPRHEVNERLEGAGRAALVGLADILKHLLYRGLPEDDVELLEDTLHRLDRRQLVRLVLLLLEDDLVQGHVLALQRLFHVLVDVVELLTTKQVRASEALHAFLLLRCQPLLLSCGLALDQGGDAFHVVEADPLVALAIQNPKNPLKVLAVHTEAKLLVEGGKVLEGKATDLVCVVLVEDSLDRRALSGEAVIELTDPILQDHPLKAPRGLELSCSLLHLVLEVSSRDGRVLAVVLQRAAELLDLISGQASLELLQALSQLALREATSLRLGLLLSPLVEQAPV